MKTLVPCVGCGRHVRTTEEACPFCNAAIPVDAASQAVPSAKARLGRAALFAFGATIAATAAACGQPSGPADTGVANDVQMADSSNMALYGAPVVDVVDPDAGDGNPGLRYGAPPSNEA
jgi:hypothetical protein